MLTATTFSRAQVHAVSDAASRSIAQIRAAVEACDHPRAAVLAFARAANGEEVPAEVVAAILPGIREAAPAVRLLAIATGDRGGAWIEAVRAIPTVPGTWQVACATVYAAWRAGADARQLAAEVRRLARVPLGLSHALLYRLAQEIDDPHLRAATEQLRGFGESELGSELIAFVEGVLGSSVAEIVGGLPAEVPTPLASGFTVRVAPRVGRNEPCPCGSGQKFKRCCIDEQAQVAPSPVAGLSWDEYLTQAADHISADDVRALSLRDLARVELAGLEDMALITALRRFSAERQWGRAARVVDELARRRGDHLGDGFRGDLVHEALGCGEVATAREQLARMVEPADFAGERLEVAIRTGEPAALDGLARAADEALRDEEGPDAIELAHVLLRSTPALGILVARGCIDTRRSLDSEMLLETIEEARDRLGLPPGDAAWDLHALLDGDDDQDREAPDEPDAEQEHIAAEANARSRPLLRQGPSHPGRLDEIAIDPDSREEHGVVVAR